MELIVAFAVLAVVLLTVTLVITTSSNTYGHITAEINLQYESQMAISQLQEYIIDCNAYVAASPDGSALYIFNKTDDSHYEAYKFTKKTDAQELYLYKKTMETITFNTADPDNFSFSSDGQLMSSYVTSFSAAVSASSVSITIKYGTGSKTYSGQQTFALRNQITVLSVPL